MQEETIVFDTDEEGRESYLDIDPNDRSATIYDFYGENVHVDPIKLLEALLEAREEGLIS